MQIIYKNINDITPYENNPRHNEAAVDKVAKSIKKFGFKVPIVIDRNNVIVCGHTRYEASKKLNLVDVPCIMADDLTDKQIKAYRLADNKVAEFSNWDFDLLQKELDELNDFDMYEFGFTTLESIDWHDVEELTEDTYKEPQKTLLQCPHCHHIDSKERFKKVDKIEKVKVKDFNIIKAELEDIEGIKKIADKYSNEIGFIIKSALEEHCKKGYLLVAKDNNNNILGFCNYNNRKDGVNVIYEVCVDFQYRGNGIARALIEKLKKPIQLKCPIDNESNNFYDKMGFQLIDVEDGKKRKLNVWELK